MNKEVKVTGLNAFLIVFIYFIVSVIGLRYGILLGFDKDIGIISPIILVLTIHWMMIPKLSGKQK